MKGIKILIFGILAFIPNIVKADCNYNEKVRLQSLASNLNFSYDYKERDEGHQFYGIDFSITVTNLNPDLYIVDNYKGKTHYYENKNEFTDNDYGNGITVGFTVYANSGSCKDVYLITNYVTLPPYNRFYIDPICADIQDYKLCKRWNRVNLSYDDFIKQVEIYKTVEDKKEENINIDDDNELIENIIDFLSKYSFYLFGGIIVVCSGLIFYLSRKDDFDLK